eukprot:TRINITY_DN1396_c0_g1_i6.p1 TRINITY_DN1396_c0_g1~~TRINITY_DN1396_c0_g1_i6.p1  ORF type:complete len:1292 (-),score=238.65 TRINITY_DN1396_c0_g1_i6:876-4694(-)
MDYETLSQSWWFIVLAYMSALLPWGVIASTDFIKSNWRSVRNTRRAGQRDLVWTFLPMLYVTFYSFVQAKAADYTEMSASAVAALLAALIGVRTVWGLWQLREFRRWAQKSIDSLHALGIEYRFHERRDLAHISESEARSSSRLSDEILVNESVIDNAITHGDARCYLRFGQRTLLKMGDEDFTIIAPVRTFWRWVAFFGAVLIERMKGAIGKGSGKKLKQVPLESVDMWVRWSTVLVSQGLQKWMSEFEVALEPETQEAHEELSSNERYMRRGKYFGAEVLGSAAMHLWRGNHSMNGMSPMLWDTWEDGSDMADGRLVKRELLQDAVQKGHCLPYEASHWDQMSQRLDEQPLEQVGYNDYKDVLKEFIAELPIRYTFVNEMEKFDVNMLEWMTILLHLGGQCETQLKSIVAEGMETEEEGSEACEVCDDTAAISRKSDEGVRTLYAQLGMVDTNNLDREMVSNIPILRNVVSLRSGSNRLTTKAGEIVDVWMSLVCGDQIQFLVEELNEMWQTVCLGTRSNHCCGWDEHSLIEEKWDIRAAHRHMTKRRLERRAANEDERHGYLDSFVTFMGYGMESVRSLIGSWVAEEEGRSGDKLFEGVRSCEQNRIEERGAEFGFEPSEDIRECLKQGHKTELLKRRGVQVRVIWELQQCMERKLQNGKDLGVKERGTGTVILFILSFPGLVVHVRESGESFGMEELRDEVRISVGEERRKRLEMDIKVMCGVQKVGVRLSIVDEMMWNVQLLWEEERNGFRWKWWRDSFIGRLEGFKEWQEEMGIRSVGIEDANEAFDRGGSSQMSELRTITGRRFRTWNEWSGFRGGIRKLELESEGFLQELKSEGAKLAGFELKKLSTTVASLPVRKMRRVCYDHANEIVLKHSCTLIGERLRRGDQDEAQKQNGPSVTNERIGRDLVDLSKQIGKAEALMVLEIAATQYEMEEALREFVETHLNDSGLRTRILDVARVLQCFQGVNTCGTDRNLRAKKGRENMMGMVVDMCEKITNVWSGSEAEVEAISDILVTCLSIDFGGVATRVMRLSRRISEVCGNSSCESLFLIESIAESLIWYIENWRIGVDSDSYEKVTKSIAVECNRTRKKVLDMTTFVGTRKEADDGDDVLSRRRWWRRCELLWSDEARKAQCMKWLRNCVENITEDVTQAFSQEEGANSSKLMSRRKSILMKEITVAHLGVRSIHSLALLLVDGAEGVERDASRAMQLYESAIANGNVYAMANLANLLVDGAEGVERDASRAMQLYESAIANGNVYAMANLANL